jgi:hypothetical protein
MLLPNWYRERGKVDLTQSTLANVKNSSSNVPGPSVIGALG